MLQRPVHIVLALIALSSEALATDRYFFDCSSKSPNGRLLIEAKSPDNAKGRARPFAANFAYTLTDTQTGKVLWKRSQPMERSKGESQAFPSEPSPVRLFVTDEGLVAARTSSDTLLVLEPDSGKKRFEAEILRAFAKEDQDKYVSMTTAGPMWSHRSDWYFLSVGSERGSTLYFVVRPYWNHRLVIDVSTGKRLELERFGGASSHQDLENAPRIISDVLGAAMKEESRRALESLAGAQELLRKPKPTYGMYEGLYAGLQTVMLLKVEEAEPALRGLEQGEAEEGMMPVRAGARQALRAIGKVPAPGFGEALYPSVDKGNYTGSDLEHPFKQTVPVEERTLNAAKIVVGMSVKELTDLIGCPDARVYDQGHCFDYDIDANPSFTLRVQFDGRQEKVEKLRRLTPFAFLHDPARQRGY